MIYLQRVKAKLERYLEVLYGGNSSEEFKDTFERMFNGLMGFKQDNTPNLVRNIHDEIIKMLAQDITERCKFFDSCKYSITES